MKRNNFSFDQDFRGNIAGVSPQQTEGSSWTKPLLLVAAGLVSAVAGLAIDSVFGTNFTPGMIGGAVGGQVFFNWFDTDEADKGTPAQTRSAAASQRLPSPKR